jgi:two-component system, OmpR family, phosphate regulon sensor histidine kinase PhoR
MQPDLSDPKFQFEFIEAAPDPTVVVSVDGICLAINAAAAALLPAMRNGGALVLGLRAPDVLEGFRRVAGGGTAEKAYWSERVPLERLFEVHIAPLRVAHFAPSNVLLTIKDLTEAKKLERMRADFIANASHELRTPLASMLGFIETLQGPAREDRAAREKFLRIMAEQGRRMARLIEDLLSLSRIEQNQYVRPSSQTDLALIAQHVCEALSPLANEMNVALNCEASLSTVVLGDRDELVRVAENLIENAIKYGTSAADDKANHVDVLVTQRAGVGALIVTDFGAGIASKHLPRLTERFYRVDVSQSRGKNGTGLGLAIVKHILVRHRGKLSVTSAPNIGTTFTAEIPLYHA